MSRFLCSGIVLAVGVALGVGAATALWFPRLLDQYAQKLLVRLDPLNEGVLRGDRIRDEGSFARVEVLYFGDSRIEAWRPLPEAGRGLNLGVGGETTAQAVRRLPPILERVRPAAVVIQSGINDLKAIGVAPELAETIERNALENLEQMIEHARGVGTRVVMLTILPVGPVSLARYPVWSDEIPAAVQRINAALLELASLEGVSVVDTEALLGEAGRMPPRYALDAFHVNAEAYRVLSPAVEGVLRGLDAVR